MHLPATQSCALQRPTLRQNFARFGTGSVFIAVVGIAAGDHEMRPT
jgi:hypothetical protein